MEQFEDRQIDDDDERAHKDDRDQAPEYAATVQREMRIDPRERRQLYRMTRCGAALGPGEDQETPDQHHCQHEPGHHDLFLRTLHPSAPTSV